MLLVLDGATVFPALNGADALAISLAQEITVLLSDIGMPDMDGPS
jgi:YesN/AraC family two-component response regulator